MNLYFLRHGIAVDRADAGSADDRSRALTPKGIKRIHREAKGLKRLSLSFDQILSSPLERARQTAKIVAQGLQMEDRLEEIEQLSPDHSVRDLLLSLAAYADKKAILLVGHEPQLSHTVSFLLSGKAGANLQLKKGGLCCLEVDTKPPHRGALLQWSLAPKHLRLMAR